MDPSSSLLTGRAAIVTGAGRGIAFLEQGPADWQKMLAVDLQSTLHCSHAVAPASREYERRRPRIIATNSSRLRTSPRRGLSRRSSATVVTVRPL